LFAAVGKDLEGIEFRWGPAPGALHSWGHLNDRGEFGVGIQPP
jgi:hypothetical protein